MAVLLSSLLLGPMTSAAKLRSNNVNAKASEQLCFAIFTESSDISPDA